MLPWICSVTDHRGRQNVVKTKKWHTTGSPSAPCLGLGFKGHFGRNILELIYYLMPNKCKNLKDTKSSCLSICTSSLQDNEGRDFLHNYYM